MINCYEILNIPNFSQKQEIRKAYLSLAKKHHPDADRDSNGEQFKIISKAYNVLQDPVTKRFHDKRLKERLSQPTTTATRPRHASNRPRSRDEFLKDLNRRKARYERIKLAQDLKSYQAQNAALPFTNRLLGFLVLCAYGWYVVFDHWFILDETTDQIIIFLGVMLYIVSATLFYSTLYKKQRMEHYEKTPDTPFKENGRNYWLLILGLGIISMLGITSYQKHYHLEHYVAYTQAEFVPNLMYNEILIKFRPPGSDKLIMKTFELNEDALIADFNYQWVLIRYSTRNPRIMEPVYRGDYLPAPLK